MDHNLDADWLRCIYEKDIKLWRAWSLLHSICSLEGEKIIYFDSDVKIIDITGYPNKLEKRKIANSPQKNRQLEGRFGLLSYIVKKINNFFFRILRFEEIFCYIAIRNMNLLGHLVL